MQAQGDVPDAEECLYGEPEVGAADVDEQPFQDGCVAQQVRPSHAPGLIEMRIWPSLGTPCSAAKAFAVASRGCADYWRRRRRGMRSTSSARVDLGRVQPYMAERR